jgi:hypothetical protein
MQLVAQHDELCLPGTRSTTTSVFSSGELRPSSYEDHEHKRCIHFRLGSFATGSSQLAQYTSSESNISWPTATYPQWSLWQYSETGEIPGINDS